MDLFLILTELYFNKNYKKEKELLIKVNESLELKGGLYHRLMDKKSTEILDNNEVSKIYLILRLYYIYKTTKNIENQIFSLEERIENIKILFFDFLFSRNILFCRIKSDEFFENISFGLFGQESIGIKIKS